MTRTFIALELNEDLQRHLERFSLRVASLLPTVRRVDVSGIHITLAFLGELSDEQVTAAIDAAQAAARTVPPFSYELTRPGIFGSPRFPRVLWMGIEEPSGRLQQLHHAVISELTTRGFAPERRPFKPHLTLARGKTPLSPDEQRALQRLLGEDDPLTTSELSYPVTCIQVMESKLHPGGASYSCLARADLKS